MLLCERGLCRSREEAQALILAGEVWSGEQLLGSRRLLAAKSVPRPGVGGRLRWYATRTVHDFLGIFS